MKSKKNPYDPMGNGTCNIQVCSAVARRRTRNYEISAVCVYMYDCRNEEVYCDVMSVGKLTVFSGDLLLHLRT
jgi:hypothetical protein